MPTSKNGALLFRIQLLPGYYLYKDKISVRSLSEAINLGDHEFIEEWSHSEIIVDEWFGEQEVFFEDGAWQRTDSITHSKYSLNGH